MSTRTETFGTPHTWYRVTELRVDREFEGWRVYPAMGIVVTVWEDHDGRWVPIGSPHINSKRFDTAAEGAQWVAGQFTDPEWARTVASIVGNRIRRHNKARGQDRLRARVLVPFLSDAGLAPAELAERLELDEATVRSKSPAADRCPSCGSHALETRHRVTDAPGLPEYACRDRWHDGDPDGDRGAGLQRLTGHAAVDALSLLLCDLADEDDREAETFRTQAHDLARSLVRRGLALVRTSGAESQACDAPES